MQGKIGLEEHFAIAETLADSGVFLPDRCWGELSRRLLDVQKERNIILGHLGEGLPYSLWRVDNPQRLGQGPAPVSGPEADRRIFPRQLPSHHRR
jgi:hypothetical protein